MTFSLKDLIAVCSLAGLGVDKLSRHAIASLGVEPIEGMRFGA
jgi:hypothetical protein